MFLALLGVKSSIKFLTRSTSRFIPECNPARREEIESVRNFLIGRPNTLVLTGAGVSTESGIPDYRSKGVGIYARNNNFRPVQYPDFVRFADVRKRYWARNFIGWERFSSIQPNVIHKTLARLEAEGRISGIVTQNVDCLHTKAGSKDVIELHGNAYTVKCLKCDYRIGRHDFQKVLKAANKDYEAVAGNVRPDGDIEISEEYIWEFNVPPCPSCGGNLKPIIVFFGENIPKSFLKQTEDMLNRSDGLLVLGSSLLVFSGYRLVLQADELGLPVVIVTIGPTRADHLADLKISARCGEVVPELLNS